MRLYPTDRTLHKLRMFLIGTAVVLGAFALVFIQEYPTFTLSSFSPLTGSLTDIGSKGGKVVTVVSFGSGETVETLRGNSLNIILTPDSDDMSDGAPLSKAITPRTRVYGYKYSSRNAEEEREARARADNGEPLLFPELFPGQFFASDAENGASNVAPEFVGKNEITFLSLSAVTLERNARYVIVTMDAGTTFTARGLVICGDGKTFGWEECDDGNHINTDACTYYCKDAACRDKFLQVKGADDIAGTADDEECDDGNEFDTDFCTNACTVSCGNGIFEPMREYLVGNDPPYPITFTTLDSTVAFADINDDGYTDKVNIDYPNVLVDQYHTISVHLGYGNGRYNNPMVLRTGSLTPSAVAIGDLNGDGHMDLAIAHGPNNTITVFLGNGTGGFSTLRNSFPTDSKPQSIAIADINDDGIMDMMTGNQGYYGQSGGKSVSVIFGVGMGAFAAKRDYPTTMIPQHTFVVDMNGDGNMDIITFNIGNSVSVLLGTEQRIFTEPTLYRKIANVVSMSIEDLNGDGKMDLATQSLNAGIDSGIVVLLGKAAGCP